MLEEIFEENNIPESPEQLFLTPDAEGKLHKISPSGEDLGLASKEEWEDYKKMN